MNKCGILLTSLNILVFTYIVKFIVKYRDIFWPYHSPITQLTNAVYKGRMNTN